MSQARKARKVNGSHKDHRDLKEIQAQGPQVIRPQGPPGPQGDPGPQGEPGIASAIIPYASGDRIVLTADTGNEPGTPVFIAFGDYRILGTALTDPFTLADTALDTAFQMPRAGVLDSIWFTFRVTEEFTPTDGELEVFAQVFIAPNDSNIYTGIPGTLIQLGSTIDGPVTPGTILQGSQDNLNVLIPAGSKLIALVFPVGNITEPTSLDGTVIGGIAINNAP